MSAFFLPSLVTLAVIFITSIISGILGMAGGLVLMGALSLMYPVSTAMIVHGSAQFFANGLRALTLRQHIYWPSLLPYIFGALLGWSVLQMVDFVPDKKTLFIFLGAVPYLALFIRRIPMDFQQKPQALICGLLISLVQTTAGVAGPLLDVFFVRTKLTRHQIVATKALTQAFSHVQKTIFYVLLVKAWPPEIDWLLVAFFIPAAFFGTKIGVNILNRLSDERFLRYTQTILLIIGAMYLIKGFSL